MYTVCVPGNNERRIFGRKMLGQSHINMSIGFKYNSFQDTQTMGGLILIAKPGFHQHVLYVADTITNCKSRSLIQ